MIAIFAPLLAPYYPREQEPARARHGCCPGPSARTWLGVDQLGRDEFCRIIYGARYSLVIGVVAVAAGLSLGLLFGAIAGYLGGFIDSLIMRCMDVMLAIPGLLLAIGIVALLGPGLCQIMIAVGIDEHPDLRAPPARLGARPARERLRARGALGRRAAAHDPLRAHPPELDLAA